MQAWPEERRRWLRDCSPKHFCHSTRVIPQEQTLQSVALWFHYYLYTGPRYILDTSVCTLRPLLLHGPFLTISGSSHGASGSLEVWVLLSLWEALKERVTLRPYLSRGLLLSKTHGVHPKLQRAVEVFIHYHILNQKAPDLRTIHIVRKHYE